MEEEVELLLALAEEAVVARHNGLTLVATVASLDQLRRMWRAADRVIVFRRRATQATEAGG